AAGAAGLVVAGAVVVVGGALSRLAGGSGARGGGAVEPHAGSRTGGSKERGRTRLLLLDVHELDVEHEGPVRGNGTRAALLVRERRRYDELALTAHLHSSDTLVPPLDDPACTQGKDQRFPTLARAIELLTVRLERTNVIHAHGIAALGGVAF